MTRFNRDEDLHVALRRQRRPGFRDCTMTRPIARESSGRSYCGCKIWGAPSLSTKRGEAQRLAPGCHSTSARPPSFDEAGEHEQMADSRLTYLTASD